MKSSGTGAALVEIITPTPDDKVDKEAESTTRIIELKERLRNVPEIDLESTTQVRLWCLSFFIVVLVLCGFFS